MVMHAVRSGSRQAPGEFAPAGQGIGLVVCAELPDGAAGAGRQQIVQVLRQYRLGTLWVALPRLDEALGWLLQQAGPAGTRVGLFTGGVAAAAALRLADERPARVAAVVSCNGRADLAGAALPRVQAPTLLIVGAADAGLLAPNSTAMRALRCEKRLELVPGAAPTFEEPGAIDAVAQLAGAWFARHLPDARWA
jgi:pimeloyl-ACP methyl ester carboxylesterase